MKRFIALILLLGSLTAGAQTKQDAVWSRVETLTRAIFEQRDSAALQRLVSSGVSYGHSSGSIENREQMIRNALTSKTTYKNLELERVDVQVDKKTALVRHNLRATSVDEKGAESPLNLGILQVWRKEGKQWRIWARQAFRINPKN